MKVRRKLSQSMGRPRNPLAEQHSKTQSSRVQVLEHRELEKLVCIKKDNELLLKKLMDVSKGKQVSSFILDQRAPAQSD